MLQYSKKLLQKAGWHAGEGLTNRSVAVSNILLITCVSALSMRLGLSLMQLRSTWVSISVVVVVIILASIIILWHLLSIQPARLDEQSFVNRVQIDYKRRFQAGSQSGVDARALYKQIIGPRKRRGVKDIYLESHHIDKLDFKKGTFSVYGTWLAHWPDAYFDGKNIEKGQFKVQVKYYKTFFGYLWPHRVYIEWLSIPFELAAKLQEIPFKDKFCMSSVLYTEKTHAMVMGPKPSSRLLPKVNISWFDCINILNTWSKLAGRKPVYKYRRGWYGSWLSLRYSNNLSLFMRRLTFPWPKRWIQWDTQANGFRLPTDSQWEYACRAGSTTKYWWGDDFGEADKYAWYSGNSGGELKEVGLKACNSFGLYDMAGNAGEWCWSLWFDSNNVIDDTNSPVGAHRVIRGGGFSNNVNWLRSADRSRFQPGHRLWSLGFRGVAVFRAWKIEN